MKSAPKKQKPPPLLQVRVLQMGKAELRYIIYKMDALPPPHPPPLSSPSPLLKGTITHHQSLRLKGGATTCEYARVSRAIPRSLPPLPLPLPLPNSHGTFGHQPSRLHLLQQPNHDFQPPSIRLRRHRHRWSTSARSHSDIMEKVHQKPNPGGSHWTRQLPSQLAIPMPTLRLHPP